MKTFLGVTYGNRSLYDLNSLKADVLEANQNRIPTKRPNCIVFDWIFVSVCSSMIYTSFGMHAVDRSSA